MPTATAEFPIEGKRLDPIYFWGVIGIGFLVLQAYIYGAWILSPEFVATDPGPDRISGLTEFFVYFIQIATAIVLVGFTTWAARKSLREKHISSGVLFSLGWLSVMWQDPLTNLYRLVFVYNAHLFNRGSWSEFIPGWVLPHGSRFPEPLIFHATCYTGFQVMWMFLMCWVMRRAKQRWPQIGIAGLVGVCFAANMMLDLTSELLFVQTHLYGFTGVIPGISLFPGKWFQFPLYETIFWGSFMSGATLVLYFKDDKGQVFVERGRDSVKSPVGRTFMRVMAISAILNVFYLIYNASMWFMSFHVGPTPPFPSYMRSGICGAGTEYACPAPGVPVPTPY